MNQKTWEAYMRALEMRIANGGKAMEECPLCKAVDRTLYLCRECPASVDGDGFCIKIIGANPERKLSMCKNKLKQLCGD